MSAKISKTKPLGIKNINENGGASSFPKKEGVLNQESKNLCDHNAAAKKTTSVQKPKTVVSENVKRETKVTKPKPFDKKEIISDTSNDLKSSDQQNNLQNNLQNNSQNNSQNDNDLSQQPVKLTRNQIIETCPSNITIINIETQDTTIHNICNVNLPNNAAAFLKVKAIVANVDDGESTAYITKLFLIKNTRNGILDSSEIDSKTTGSESLETINLSLTYNGTQIGLNTIGTDNRLRWSVQLFILKTDFTKLDLSDESASSETSQNN